MTDVVWNAWPEPTEIRRNPVFGFGPGASLRTVRERSGEA